MKKSDHISIYESGINSIQLIGQQIYGCTPNKIIIVDKENTVETIPYNHEEIYQFQTDGVRIFGKDMYGGTYSINANGVTKLNEQIIDFYNEEIKRIKKEGKYFLIKFEKEILDFRSKKIGDYLIKDNLVIFVDWQDRTNHNIVAFELESNREIWRTQLQSGERVQQLLALTNSSIYLTGYNGQLYQIDIETGSFQITFIEESKKKSTNIPRAKIDRKNLRLIHPEIEIDLPNKTITSRILEGEILDNGVESIEHYFRVSDYTFDNEHIYIQVHSYPDVHSKNNTSKIIQLKRNNSEVLSKFYINPEKKSIDAKQLILLDDQIVILDVHGKLMKKKIKYET